MSCFCLVLITFSRPTAGISSAHELLMIRGTLGARPLHAVSGVVWSKQVLFSYTFYHTICRWRGDNSGQFKSRALKQGAVLRLSAFAASQKQ